MRSPHPECRCGSSAPGAFDVCLRTQWVGAPRSLSGLDPMEVISYHEGVPTWVWILFADVALFFIYYSVILSAFMPDPSRLRRDKLTKANACMRQGRRECAMRALDHALYSPGNGRVSVQEATVMHESLDTLQLLVPYCAEHPDTLNLKLALNLIIGGSSSHLELDKLIAFRDLVGFDDVERMLAAMADGIKHYFSEPDNAEAAPDASAWLQEIARPSHPPQNKAWTIYSLILSFFPIVAPPAIVISGTALSLTLDRASIIALLPMFMVAWHSVISLPVMLRVRGRRIVLLRLFSEGSADFVRNSIGPTLGSYGSLITVSDRFLRHHVSTRNRLFPGTRRVSDWISGKRYFPIANKGDWKTPVGYLIWDAHLVVIDLSVISDSLAWEIEQCLEREDHVEVVLLYNSCYKGAYNSALLRWPALRNMASIEYCDSLAGSVALRVRFFVCMRKLRLRATDDARVG